jgi:phage terminase small subunit
MIRSASVDYPQTVADSSEEFALTPERAEPEPEVAVEELPALPELNARQQRFVQEYLVDLNGTHAVIRSGYSPVGASVTATRLLAHPSVAAHVDRLKKQRAAVVGISQEAILHEMNLLASARIDWFCVDDNGELRTTALAPEGAMACIASLKKRKITKLDKDDQMTVTHEVEFRLWDKPGTLKLMGRHIGLFPDKVEVSGPGGKPIETVTKIERVIIDKVAS